MKKIIVLITYVSSLKILAGFFVPNFKATYFQEYKSELKGKLIQTKGTIEYSYPSKIKFEQETPDKLLYISNPSQSWLYTPPLFDDMEGDLIVDPTGKNYPYAKLFDVLKAGLKDNQYYKVVEVDKVKKIYQFTYSDKMKKNLGLAKTILKFRKNLNLKDISLLEMVYHDGKKVKLTLEKIDTDIKYPVDHFVFKKVINKEKN